MKIMLVVVDTSKCFIAFNKSFIRLSSTIRDTYDTNVSRGLYDLSTPKFRVAGECNKILRTIKLSYKDVIQIEIYTYIRFVEVSYT